jgi:hypothetical protein
MPEALSRQGSPVVEDELVSSQKEEGACWDATTRSRACGP